LIPGLGNFGDHRNLEKANPASGLLAGFMVELSGVEPLTS